MARPHSASGSLSAHASSAVVDLPEPVWPTSAVSVPGNAGRERSSRARGIATLPAARLRPPKSPRRLRDRTSGRDSQDLRGFTRSFELQGLHSHGACERLRGGPVERDAPLFEDEHAVGISKASSMKCVTCTMVMPRFRRAFTMARMLERPWVSSMAQGSSSSRIFGSMASADAGTALGVEHGAGLVEQQDLWFHGERAGDGDALGLAAGQVGGVA